MTRDPGKPVPPDCIYEGSLTESAKWQQYVARAGDVIVSTPPKSGTTWTQGILGLLISGDPQVDANPSVNAPWFDTNFSNTPHVLSTLAAQTGQRHVKTHTPLDGVPYWDSLHYICVYRHPIDVYFSARKHVANYSDDVAEERFADPAQFCDDPKEGFGVFLSSDRHEDHGTLKLIVRHYLECLKRKPRDNLLRLHYADMTRDLAAQMALVADHIGVNHPPALMDQLIEAATFRNMKANASRFALAQGRGVWRNDSGFFDSGTSNKWDGVLDQDDLAAYDAAIAKMLSPQDRKWLEWGTV